MIAVLGALVVLGFAVCTGSSDSGPGPRSGDSVPADEEAANGPLVGDPGLLPSERSCVASEPNAP